MMKLKKMISRYLWLITFFMVIGILVMAVALHILNEQRRARESAAIMFYQMNQILTQNQKDLAETEAEYRETCLHNAETIAYIIQEQPSVLESVDELRKIADFTEVDEIHIFDKSGRIFTGTHPEYYDYTFDSGEQIAFFKPMLTDKSLKLCQDITPNTAEEKLMQYSALWSSNGEFIVQVGMEPVNVMQVTEKNELSYIFSLLRVNPGIDFYAIDAQAGTVVGATVLEDVGKNVTEIGLTLEQIEGRGVGFHDKIKGVACYCVFSKIGENYIGRVVPNSTLYQSVPSEIIELGVWLVLIAIGLVFSVSAYMNRYVVNGIYDVNRKLRTIAQGDLEEKVDVQNSQEFAELSSHINDMIQSILGNTEKLSYVLDRTDMRIGVYEYNEYMTKVRFTEYVPQMLALEKNDYRLADCRVFREFVDKIRQNPVEDEEGVFCLPGENALYIKIEEVVRNNDILGIMIDVTEEVCKRRLLEKQRDIDLLTGLYNRRGMESKLAAAFEAPEKSGYSALVMIDADGLKLVNDQYGHEKGDLYLRKLAEVLGSFEVDNCIASRQGGDEFVLFLHGYGSEEALLAGVGRLQYMQDSSMVQLTEDIQVPLRFSMGYCIVREWTDFHSLLEEADRKMYENKRQRKARN